MKLSKVTFNNRRHDFTVTAAGRVFSFPYAKTTPEPSPGNLVDRAYVDHELGNEAFTYVLRDGSEGTVHIDHVLEYNQDPEIMLQLFMHALTVEVKNRLSEGNVAKRTLARRLNTSPTQLYRLLDEKREAKSIPQLFTILHALGCDVTLAIGSGSSARRVSWTACAT